VSEFNPDLCNISQEIEFIEPIINQETNLLPLDPPTEEYQPPIERLENIEQTQEGVQ
jgi:hypothetical protein